VACCYSDTLMAILRWRCCWLCGWLERPTAAALLLESRAAAEVMSAAGERHFSFHLGYFPFFPIYFHL